MKYIATISFGKDSTTMCDLLLKNGYPVDYVIFNDTLSEYPEMYEYKNKVFQYFKLRYGVEIIDTTPIRDFEQSVMRKVTRSKTLSRNGQYVGIPVASSGKAMCHLRKTLKMNPFDKWIRKNIKEDYVVYQGITIDEKDRAIYDGINQYPLIDTFNMSELDCKNYLIEHEMENPLYKNFLRTGCALCPFKSERDWFNTWKYHNDIFEQGKSIEAKLKDQKEYKYFYGNKPLSYHEKKFKRNNVNLFDFSDEPVKDCFCKI